MSTDASAEPLIRDISDTARWVAVYRARETERPDALFSDPFAKRLAGARGEQIADAMPNISGTEWPFVMRTHLFDRFVTDEVGGGVDLVLNLAAGLDTRPYRMALPRSLAWIEVDLPGILDYKEGVLAGETPVCALERVRLDLSDVSARRALFDECGRRARKALIISEGLLIYLTADEVGALAGDLARPSGLKHWLIDLASPGLLQMLQQRMGSHVNQAGAPFTFGPEEGPAFFERYGWKPIDVQSLLKTAARLRRLPFYLRLMAMLPERAGPQGKRVWSGVCLLANTRDS